MWEVKANAHSEYSASLFKIHSRSVVRTKSHSVQWPLYIKVLLLILMQVYTQCSCISSGNTTRGIPGLEEAGDGDAGYALRGKCPWSCNKMFYFFAMMPIGSFLGAMMNNPAFMLQFRSVLDSELHMRVIQSNIFTLSKLKFPFM